MIISSIIINIPPTPFEGGSGAFVLLKTLWTASSFWIVILQALVKIDY
ncbi:hypothetical protein HMPREF9075_01142 [Capnocytophaga sp. oral taxon 332 str. F0381]|nr:hypothetical protein HMPREF9075_01142 [Capnocytophaga sp. oral taxon 332 str. F0381]